MRRMFDEKEIKALGAEGAVAEIAKGNVENAKPLYYHPVIMYNDSANYVRVSFWIINQKSDNYTRESFLAFLKTLDQNNMRLNVTGGVIAGVDGPLIVSDVVTQGEEDHRFVGMKVGTGAIVRYSSSIESILADTANSGIADSVNKIN